MIVVLRKKVASKKESSKLKITCFYYAKIFSISDHWHIAGKEFSRSYGFFGEWNFVLEANIFIFVPRVDSKKSKRKH